MKNLLIKWFATDQSDDKSIVRLLIKGYFLLTLLCFLCLLIPFCQSESHSFVDHIFYSVSIVSTTGLSPSSFGEDYNFLGQLISLIFIQLGGVGYMALGSFVILKQTDRLPRLSARLLRLEFNLPKRYPLGSFIYSVFIFTLLLELLGAIFLYKGFKAEGVEDALWYAIFHSVSAFCTAGFSLYSDSMTSFQDNNLITNTILTLSLLGSIGFIVLLDFWLKIIGRRKSITLTTKIILITTFLFCLSTAIIIYLSDEAISQMGLSGFQIALFQAISAHTTVGFNNYDLGNISLGATFIMIVLMIIGASPAGTGGGIKTTSITALFAVLRSVLKRKKHITFLSKEIPAQNIYLAISSLIFYAFISFLGTWSVLIIEGERFGLDQILFEVVSALSTVGLSTGITGDLSNMSKLIIAMLMFVGRLGVLTFGFALITKAPLLRHTPKVEDIAI